MDCNEGEYCHWMYGACGTPQSGSCVAAANCSSLGPVCGCDGHVYSTDCDAYAAGVDLAAEVPCPEPQGHFRCGWFFCESGMEFCVRTTGLTSDWRCEPLPTECSSGVDCSCIDIACDCGQSPAGDITVTCLAV